MGNTESRFGYHVLKVKPESPASKAGLISYFDYIVAVNEQLVAEENQALLANAAKSSLDQPMQLTVYNSRSDSVRRAQIVPSLSWGDERGGMLGCSVRFVECSNAQERVWHVLSVAPGGSAERAGLLADEDYIIASLDKVLVKEEDFLYLIEKNPKESLKFVVYNSRTNACREVVVEVGMDEFKKGIIGCEIGFGQIHQVPVEGETRQPPMNAEMTDTLLLQSKLSETPSLPVFSAAQPSAVVPHEAMASEQMATTQVACSSAVQVSNAVPSELLQDPVAFQPTHEAITPHDLEQQYAQFNLESNNVNVAMESSMNIVASTQNPATIPQFQLPMPEQSQELNQLSAKHPTPQLPIMQQTANQLTETQTDATFNEPVFIVPADQVAQKDQPAFIAPASISVIPQLSNADSEYPPAHSAEYPPIQSSEYPSMHSSDEINIENVIFSPQDSLFTSVQAVQSTTDETCQPPVDFFSQSLPNPETQAKMETMNHQAPSIERLFANEMPTNSCQIEERKSEKNTQQSDDVDVQRQAPDSKHQVQDSNQITQLFQSSAAIDF